MNTKFIDSIQNPFVKTCVQLREQSNFRKEKDSFLVEGFKEILMAIKGTYEIKQVLLQKNIFKKGAALKKYIPENKFVFVSENVYQKLALRKKNEGIIAVAKPKKNSLENLTLSKNPLILVVESIEKPGNLGAILRTADACGAEAVFVSNPLVDVYNPHLIRNSLGCVFTVPIFWGENEKFIAFLKNNKIKIYTSQLDAAENYLKINYKKACAIVMGNENKGLSETWQKTADKKIKIPMRGKIDSMNVSVATAVLMFEALRQRNC